MTDDSIFLAQGDSAIEVFQGLPLMAPATIAILGDSPEAEKYAKQLATSVGQLLTSVHPQVAMSASACKHGAADVPLCGRCAAAGRQLLLVLVSDGATGWPTIPHQEWWIARESDRHILPVVKQGVHPERLVPEPLRKLNAYFWKDSITEARNAVLRAAGVTIESYRVFISYKRRETQPVAEQLFDELNRQGFSVFLDMYSVPPALQFQRRLGQELAEKGMVVLLESEKFLSRWTQEEVDVCKRYQIGVLAVQMPHGLSGQPVAPVATLDKPRRITLKVDEFVGSPRPVPDGATTFLEWGRLKENGSPSALDNLVQQIRDEHDRALLDRRRTMRDDMSRFLVDAKAPAFQWRPDGFLTVSSGGRHYAVLLASRPAELADFHLTYRSSRTPPDTKGVLIAPRDLLEPDVQMREAWLSGLCEFSSHDPGEMLEVAEKMAQGTL
jgi:hypothetical protein